MGQLETHIFSVVTGDAAVAALMGTRFYPMRLPQDPTFPAAVYQRINGGQVTALDGATGKERPLLQITVWHFNRANPQAAYAVAKDLAKKIRDALNGSSFFSATIRSDADEYESETDRYGVRIECSFGHKE